MTEYDASTIRRRCSNKERLRRPHAAREFPQGGEGGREDRVRHRRRRVPARLERASSSPDGEWGQTPMQAIKAATASAADLLAGGQGGRGEEGPVRRLIAVSGDRSQGRHGAGAGEVRDEGRVVTKRTCAPLKRIPLATPPVARMQRTESGFAGEGPRIPALRASSGATTG